MSYSIIRASIEDVPEILEDLKEFSKFFDTKKSLFGDYETSKKIIESFVKDHLFLIATNPNGDLVGFISGLITPCIYNPTISTLVESFWWVKPDFRGSKAGMLLLEEFIQIGKENFDWVVMTLEEQSPVKDEVLLSRGFKPKERSFLLEVE